MSLSAHNTQSQLDFKIKKGLDLPIAGAPDQQIEDGPTIVSCALIGADHLDLKAKLLVAEGDHVHLGQPLFSDRRFERVFYTAPAGGVVRAINRGARRVLQSVVIDLDDEDDPVVFTQVDAAAIDGLDRDLVKENLLKSGLGPALRTRPYSKLPDPASTPAAIFVTAMDSSPLAADAGTHIHLLDPVHADKTVWYINYQDAMAFGKLFRTGRLPTERVISLAGPAAKRPRLLRSRLGAAVDSLLADEVDGTKVRVIAGNVLTGRVASGPFAFLGRFHQQITLMPEGGKRELFGWLIPSMRKFATANVHISSLVRGKRIFPFNTGLNGSPRAMIPVGLYEDVMPLDILATQLLRALLIMDTEDAQSLGCLELDEEDLALCSYVCMSKYEYGMALRANLEKIEVEG
jgi:Na+-transporting NADH:ubiquinone oxidoreductase subunit A